MRSPAAWFARQAAREPSAPAVTFQGETWSYGAMRARVARMASLLKLAGVGPGDRVGTLAHNHPDILTALFGCSSIGAVLVPMNMRLASDELVYIAQNAGLSAILADDAGANLLEPVRAQLQIGTWLTIGRSRQDWRATGEILDQGIEDHHVHEGDVATALAAIVYTSGTTGRPKGAMLTNGNLWANDLNWMSASGIRRSDVALIGAPMFHVGGLFVLTSTTLLVGGHVVILPTFDSALAIRAIEQHGVTTSFGVPAMMLFISQDERFDMADLSSLRLYVAGGAPVPEPLLRRYAERGIPVSQCYGLSEVTSATTFLDTGQALAKIGSAGRPGLLSEIVLKAPDGMTVGSPFSRGEICVRGANVSPGYWRASEATSRTIDADGWLHTGDVGYLDDDGHLFVCDRLKDMIISGGENVYPAEVESVLFDHPAISNVAVIGRADDRWGERVVAIVVPRAAASLTLADLEEFCRSRLARYKQPRELILRDDLPLNGSGKVLKGILRAELENA